MKWIRIYDNLERKTYKSIPKYQNKFTFHSFILLFSLKSFYFNETVKEWNSEYLASNKGYWTKRFLPTITFRTKLLHFKTDFLVTQFLTGHGHFKDYLNKFYISSCGLCDCGQDRENPEHLLFFCSRLNSQRDILVLKLKKPSCSFCSC